MKVADRLKSVLDGGTDPEVCLFQVFRTTRKTVNQLQTADEGRALIAGRLARIANSKDLNGSIGEQMRQGQIICGEL